MYHDCQEVELMEGLGFVRDHVWVSVDSERTEGMPDWFPEGRYIFAKVDDYNPGDEEDWDEDEWEARKAYLFFSLAGDPRTAWYDCYRVARKLSKRGSANLLFISDGESLKIEIPSTTYLA